MAVLADALLLEREGHLESLRLALDEATRDSGRIVLVAGEAGVGKTALVASFRDAARDRVRVLEGACDNLFTPRPLAPIADVASATGGQLERVVERGARAYEVLPFLLDELDAEPTLVVVEDLHWADEATLDLVLLLARRIGSTRALVVATYRDDELGQTHPLRLALARITAAPTAATLQVPRLSLGAVRELAEAHEIDAEGLFAGRRGTPSSSPKRSRRAATRSRRPSATQFSRVPRGSTTVRAAFSMQSRSCRRGPSSGCSRPRSVKTCVTSTALSCRG